MNTVQYTIRAIPTELDRAIRKKARLTGKSINQVVLDTVSRAFGLSDEVASGSAFDDLKEFFGTRGVDDETLQILQELEQQDKASAKLQWEHIESDVLGK